MRIIRTLLCIVSAIIAISTALLLVAYQFAYPDMTEIRFLYTFWPLMLVFAISAVTFRVTLE